MTCCAASFQAPTTRRCIASTASRAWRHAERNKARKYRGERTPLVAALRANQTWSLDFVSDARANGRRIKCLTITDDFTRECIDIAVDLSMPGAYVARVLERAACFRGYPQAIRTDNGPEFTRRALMAWLQARGIEHILQRPVQERMR